MKRSGNVRNAPAKKTLGDTQAQGLEVKERRRRFLSFFSLWSSVFSCSVQVTLYRTVMRTSDNDD